MRRFSYLNIDSLDTMNITVTFNELLRERNAPETKKRVSLDAIDGFLKEAYRIVSALHPLRRAPQANQLP